MTSSPAKWCTGAQCSRNPCALSCWPQRCPVSVLSVPAVTLSPQLHRSRRRKTVAGLLNALVQVRRPGRAHLPAVVPPQRGEPSAAGSGAEAGQPDGGGPAGEVLPAATQRVWVIVEGPDDPDETQRAVEALGSQPGWKVRTAQPHDRLMVTDGRVVLVIDALAYGVCPTDSLRKADEHGSYEPLLSVLHRRMAGDSEVRIALRVAATLKGSMVRACQPSGKAALIYQHSDHHRRKEVLVGLNGMVTPRGRRLPSRPRRGDRWCASGARRLDRSGQRQSPRSLTWGFALERMTGIEPAL